MGNKRINPKVAEIQQPLAFLLRLLRTLRVVKKLDVDIAWDDRFDFIERIKGEELWVE